MKIQPFLSYCRTVLASNNFTFCSGKYNRFIKFQTHGRATVTRTYQVSLGYLMIWGFLWFSSAFLRFLRFKTIKAFVSYKPVLMTVLPAISEMPCCGQYFPIPTSRTVKHHPNTIGILRIWQWACPSKFPMTLTNPLYIATYRALRQLINMSNRSTNAST